MDEKKNDKQEVSQNEDNVIRLPELRAPVKMDKVLEVISKRLREPASATKYSPLPLSDEEVDALSLSQQIELLPELTLHQKYDLILKSQYPAKLVQSLPAQDLLYIIKEVGEDEGFDLLEFATSEQIQGIFDIDTWHRDELDADSYIAYLDKLYDKDPLGAAKKIEKLDRANLLLALLKKIHVVRKEWFEEREDLNEDNYYTIDDNFSFEWRQPDANNEEVWHVISNLYKYNQELYRWLMEASLFELPMEVEEFCFKEKEGRLSELGFPDFMFSLEVLQREPVKNILAKLKKGKFPKDKALISEGENKLPVLYRRAEEGELTLVAALKRLPPEWANAVRTEMVYLANRIIIARHFEADYEKVQDAIAWMRDHINLGLEYLSGGSIDEAESILKSTALVGIFRLGFNLGLHLRDRARKIVRRFGKGFTVKQMPILTPLQRELMLGLINDFPQFLSALGKKEDNDIHAYRPFRYLSDFEAASKELIKIEATLNFLFDILHIPADFFENFSEKMLYPYEVSELEVSHVFNTALILKIVEGEFSLRGLDTEDIEKFASKTVEHGRIDPQMRADLAVWLRALTGSWDETARDVLLDAALESFDRLANEIAKAFDTKDGRPDFSAITSVIIRKML